MLIVHHRRNTVELLKDTDNAFGVEIDIRSYKDKLILHHDPFVDSVTFEDWLVHYNHKFLILNTKEEGLEKEILALLDNHNISNFFFLDQSFPFLIKTALSGERRTAVRVSNYESIETALSLSNLVEWVWLDVFKSFPISEQQFLQLQNSNFKLCLVSPELQNHPEELIRYIQKFLNDSGLKLDAVCTKYPFKWSDNIMNNVY